jgi:hypothetical protein
MPQASMTDRRASRYIWLDCFTKSNLGKFSFVGGFSFVVKLPAAAFHPMACYQITRAGWPNLAVQQTKMID